MTFLSLSKRWLLFPFLCAVLAGSAFSSEPPPLKLGILPFNSTMALIRVHQPLTSHLEKVLGRKIQVLSSSDYFTHINQLLAGDFDLIISAPHFTVIAAEKGRYIPLVKYAAEMRPSFVLSIDSTIKGAADVRGKRVGIPNRMAIISASGVRWLEEQGLQKEKDYRLVEFPSHGAVIAAVAAGDVDVGISDDSGRAQTPENVRSKTRLMPLGFHLPHVMTSAHSRLPKADIERVRQGLLSFGETPAGQTFLRDNGYLGYAEITKDDLKRLLPYVELTVNMMR